MTNVSSVTSRYTQRFNLVLKRLDVELREFLENLVGESEFVCKISTRPKKISSFIKKAEQVCEDGQLKYVDPLSEIQDQIGALIVTRFLSDVSFVEASIHRMLRRIERRVIEPESEYEFGYVGRHFILFLPTDITSHFEGEDFPDFFELQIKTLFQYAWSETNHAIGYKRHDELSPEQKRLTSYVAAQAWGADRAVEELRSEFAIGGTHNA